MVKAEFFYGSHSGLGRPEAKSNLMKTNRVNPFIFQWMYDNLNLELYSHYTDLKKKKLETICNGCTREDFKITREGKD